jgi:hypothetical protein
VLYSLYRDYPTNIDSQRGTRDAPNSMGAESRRAEGPAGVRANIDFPHEYSHREGRGTRPTAWAPKGKEPRPTRVQNTNIEIYREGRETRLTAWATKGEEAEAKPSAKHTRGEAKHKQTRAT